MSGVVAELIAAVVALAKALVKYLLYNSDIMYADTPNYQIAEGEPQWWKQADAAPSLAEPSAARCKNVKKMNKEKIHVYIYIYIYISLCVCVSVFVYLSFRAEFSSSFIQ